MPKTTKADLETRLATQASELSAMHEWFLCTTRPDVRGNVTLSLTVDNAHGDEPIRVEAYGLARAGGGVAVVRCGSFADYPETVDTLIARWSDDHNWQIRDAARKLRRAQEEALRERFHA